MPLRKHPYHHKNDFVRDNKTNKQTKQTDKQKIFCFRIGLWRGLDRGHDQPFSNLRWDRSFQNYFNNFCNDYCTFSRFLKKMFCLLFVF